MKKSEGGLETFGTDACGGTPVVHVIAFGLEAHSCSQACRRVFSILLIAFSLADG